MENTKKICLITYHRAINYGSILQAYATKKLIEDLGFKCDVLDYESYSQHYFYRVRYIPNLFKLKFDVKSLKLVIKKIIGRIKINKEKNKKFDDFLYDNFNLTQKCNSIKCIYKLNLEEQYDVFLTGSDQTWNDYAVEHIYNKEKSILPYFLFFVSKKKKIAFSTSIGNTTSHLLTEKKEYIEQYDYIALREEVGKEKLLEITNKDIDVVIDPTLILSKDEWNSLISNERVIKDNYILLYSLCTNSTIEEWVKEIDKFNENKHFKIVTICPFVTKRINGIINFNNAGPYEFLKLFRDASYTIVDSFHGLCFSIIYRKNFFVLGNKYNKKDIRKKNILSKFDLLDRLIENESELCMISDEIDYTNSEKLIKEEINKAKEILKKYLI